MNDLARVKEQQKRVDSMSFAEKMNRLEKMAACHNPFYKCSWSLAACRGIAKAVLMLFPHGREGSSQPSKATIEKTRRFLKVKVKRHVVTDGGDLPSVEMLLLPELFAADLGLHSHLRISGKEVLTPCVLPKIIWLAVSALNLQTRMSLTEENPNVTLNQGLPKDGKGRHVAYLNEAEVPKIAQWLQLYCVIPGGPWSIYGAISAGLPVEDESVQKQGFQAMQAKLLQKDEQKTNKKLPFVNTPKTVAIVYNQN